MEPTQSPGEPVQWMGEAPEERKPAAADETFGSGDLWFGRHAADRDVLVLDPSRTDPDAEPLALYSLSQHRTRSFPRAVVLRHIRPLSDAAERDRARREYEDRVARRNAHQAAAAEAAEGRTERLRDKLRTAHRAYLETLGVEYAGVSETSGTRASGHRSKCYACGIAIDDFARLACGVCGSALCSCGACACGSPRRNRSRAEAAEAAGDDDA